MSKTESKDESEGMDEANLKIPSQPNPAFPNRSSREPSFLKVIKLLSTYNIVQELRQIKKLAEARA